MLHNKKNHEAPLLRPLAGQSTNSLGYSCDQADYPGKNFGGRHVFQVHVPKTGGTSIERWSRLAGYDFKHEHLMPPRNGSTPTATRASWRSIARGGSSRRKRPSSVTVY